MADAPIDPPSEMLPMPQTGPGSMDYWRQELESSKTFMRNLADSRRWDQNLQAYLGKGLSATPSRDTVVVNKDFSLVEGKKALLFFQTPDVAAIGSAPEFEQAAPLVAQVVSDQLRKIAAKAMVDEILTDVLCPSGVGIAVLGYEAFVDPKEPAQMIPDAMNPMQPQLGPDGQPVLMPKIVRERYFWERVGPKRFRYPATFISSDWDKSPWLAYDFDLPKVVAEKIYDLTPDEVKDAAGVPDPTRDLLTADVTRATAADVTNKVTLTALWYRAADCDPMVGDPEIFRQMVLMEGRDAPLVHRDSPFQTISDGKLVNGMKGNPIHPLTLRYASDMAIPPSDCSMSRQQVDEMSRGRTQMVQQRDRAVPLVTYDTSRLPTEAVDKIVSGQVQEMIAVNGMDAANPAVMEVRRASWPRENFGFNDIINRDIAEQWSLGPNQLGVDTDTRRTATELSIMQSATDTRMDAERVKVLNWYAKGCEKLLALLQKFADEQQFAQVVGPNGMPALVAWDKTAIAGDFSITLAPDSSQRVDAAADKKRAVDIFGMLGNDPLVNQVELRKWLMRKLGMDPEKLVKVPEPKPPQQPNVSVAIKGEDLNPMMPQYTNVASLLSVSGIGMAPAAGPEGPPLPNVNPGSVAPVSPIGKRTDEQTGQLPGAGMAPQANV